MTPFFCCFWQLICLQQDRTEEEKAIETMREQLETKTQMLRDLEIKYKLILKMHKESKEKQFEEMAQKEEVLLKQHQDELNKMKEEYLCQMKNKEEEQRLLVEEEREKCQKEVNRWRREMEQKQRENSLLGEQLRKEKGILEEEVINFKFLTRAEAWINLDEGNSEWSLLIFELRTIIFFNIKINNESFRSFSFIIFLQGWKKSKSSYW